MLFLKGVASTNAVVMEVLELPFWVMQSVSVVVDNEKDIVTFIFGLEFRIFWVE